MKKHTTCAKCGRKIENVYSWEGQEYGIECWKQIALPVILAERAKRDEERLQTILFKSRLIAEALQQKDLSRIGNAFKLRFIPSVIEQVAAGRPLSRKQREIAMDFFNTRDWLHYHIAEWVIEGADAGELAHVKVFDQDRGYKGKFLQAMQEAFGELPAQVDYYGDVI